MQKCARTAPAPPPPPTHTRATQANLWIAIFGFIGNYYWTHYFFNILGAAYTFPSFKLNQVRAAQHVAS